MSRKAAVASKVQVVCYKASVPELTELAPVEWLTAVQEQSRHTLDVVCSTESKAVEIVSSVADLSRCCIALARETGLSSTVSAVLVAESLAAAALLFAPEDEGTSEDDVGIDRLKVEHRAPIARFLEPIGDALDSFTVEIFEGLRRLESSLKPEWVVPGAGMGGHLVLCADGIDPADIERFEALQAVCVWSLALVVRGVGYTNFSARDLWAFASGEVFCALVFAKATLSFQQGDWTSVGRSPTVSVPEELPALKEAIMAAVCGLCSQDVAFLFNDDVHNGDIPIEVRNDSLLLHQASIAAASSECGLLDCLLAHRWIVSSHRLPALLGFIRDCINSASLPRCSIVLMALIEQVERFKHQLASKHRVLWTLLRTFLVPSRSFLRDGAVLALVAEPSLQDATSIIDQCLSTSPAGICSDSFFSSALIVIASSAGKGPGETAVLAAGLAELLPEQRVRTAGQLWRWLDKSIAGSLCHQTLSAWMNYLNVPQTNCPDEDPLADVAPKQASSQSAVPVHCGSSVPSSQPQLKSGLRGIVSDAPANFRCVLDGRLLVDPVKSPTGHVFERSVLAKHLQASGNVCPITGSALSLANCARDTELRKNIAAWIKSTKEQQKLPAMFSAQ